MQVLANKLLAEEKAQQILSEYFAGVYPVDPVKIATNMGLCVLTTKLKDEVSGCIKYHSKEIFIEINDPLRRKIFSVAHELGHFVLHNDQTEHISFRDTISAFGTDIKEIEANTFAANLLMPKDEIAKLVGLKFNLESMADYFMVSSVAMENRLNSLKINVYR